METFAKLATPLQKRVLCLAETPLLKNFLFLAKDYSQLAQTEFLEQKQVFIELIESDKNFRDIDDKSLLQKGIKATRVERSKELLGNKNITYYALSRVYPVEAHETLVDSLKIENFFIKVTGADISIWQAKPDNALALTRLDYKMAIFLAGKREDVTCEKFGECETAAKNTIEIELRW